MSDRPLEPVQGAATIQEIEQALGQIQNITLIRLVTDHSGEIQEIHALADTGRSPKQIVRDIESMMMARWNLKIDHKKISIAQLGDEDQANSEPSRLEIRSVSVKKANLIAEVKVELVTEQMLGEGQVSGPASSANLLRLVAEATLRAVQQFVKGDHYFLVEDIRKVTLARFETMVVCITLLTPLGEETFLGTCIVRKDDVDAVMRATLDALNRKLGLISVALHG
ncbi:MAG: hypothetical protein ACM3TT_02180 [Syntrophothermus sp.]